MTASGVDDIQAVVQGVATEVAFPECAMYELDIWETKLNEERLRALRDGRAYRCAKQWGLTTGTTAEGLAIDDEWGHGVADWDVMILCGADLGVYVPSEDVVPEDVSLVYRPEGCPAGYCRLEVRNVTRFTRGITQLKNLIGGTLIYQQDTADFIANVDGKQWLKSVNFLRAMQNNSDRIQGPAGQHHNGSIEWVPTLVCSGAHPCMAAFVGRPRQGWPTRSRLEALRRLPLLLVLVGHKASSPDLQHQQCRVSWSPHEMELVGDITCEIRHGFIMFKYTLKSLMRRLRGAAVTGRSGRSLIGSYHLKTILFHMLEQTPPEPTQSAFEVMLELLRRLRSYVVVAGTLPHYFTPQCDLLQTVGTHERWLAVHAAQTILADPLSFVLHSPVEPGQLYGPVAPSTLEAAMYHYTMAPNSDRRRADLQQIIRQLYEHRV